MREPPTPDGRTSVGVRPARREEAAALDHVLAAAFFGDPITVWLLPDESRRAAALRRGLGHALRETYLPHGGAWTTDALDGVALWAKPDRPKPSALEQLGSLPTFAAVFGRRLPRALRAFASVEKRRPAEPHWFLDVIAVRPDRQGHGIGSALVATGLAEADRAAVPAFVVTSNARNVPLYERFGFAVAEEYDAGPVHAWAMLRPPGTG